MKKILVMLVLSMLALSVFASKIAIVGSTTVLPIAQQWAQAYMKMNPDVNISVVGNGSGNGIKALLDGVADIADSSRWMSDTEIKSAVSKGLFPFPIVVAYDAIAPIVNSDNPVRNLTLDQLQQIYSGKITNWSQVGGPDMPIVVVTRDNSSGTFEVWAERVMRGMLVKPEALTVASNAEVVRAVASNKRAIGYVGLAYLESGSNISEVAISGMKANVEAARSGAYPLARPLFMIVNGIPSNQIAKFINFGLSPAGQKIVAEVGFVPIYEVK
ncbi:PstS family phosphate ABC transporter substrate-binding protein [Athalassotoga saccharophila]|uniref:PstS family phosphate ABC transporter substrate-binding protein n=1 Tax=Athalassotoga saccharophila TaxID=1441386 RepID=UPI001379772B|nr:PstS family phosphate ABC transporter substrate-binding protein [Athalassotoga saccharophila]BBJ28108.1 phosphate-binding protein PstS [Athalassotoga saccharophila]